MGCSYWFPGLVGVVIVLFCFGDRAPLWGMFFYTGKFLVVNMPLFRFPKKRSHNRFNPWASDSDARGVASKIDNYAHINQVPVKQACVVHDITLAELFSARNGYMSQRNVDRLVASNSSFLLNAGVN